MKIKNLFFTLLGLALVDDLITLAFPVNFQYQGISFIPHFCFVALLLNVYDRDWKDRILISAFVGLMMDLFFMDTFMIYSILYGILGYCSGIFSKYMQEDDRFLFFVVWVLVFFVDFIPVSISMLNHMVHVPFVTWFVHHEAFTLALHVVIIIFLMYCFVVYNRYETIRMHRKKRFERKKYKKLKQEF